MQTYNINSGLLNVLFSDSIEEAQEHLISWLHSYEAGDFTTWLIKGNICQSSFSTLHNFHASFDIYELGFPGGSEPVKRNVSFFDENFYISWAFFFGSHNGLLYAITFHSDNAINAASEIANISEFISKRVAELFSINKRMDLYVDYQKKVDFIKGASVIFKALEIENAINLSLAFFSEIFSADAVCALWDGKFYGIGLEEKNIDENIFISDVSLRTYMNNITETEYTENSGSSDKFYINNIFFVYEESIGISFALFNIVSDIVPDREFSSIVSGVVSIAVENAVNHEQMTEFKIEETEMNSTVDILDRFVTKKIRSHLNGTDIFAMNYPAKKAGGDYIEVKESGSKIKFCIADVCGKGYTAAVFTVVLSAFFSGRNTFNLYNCVGELNRYMIEKNFDDKFITAFFAIFDTETRKLEYIYCGHEPVVLITDKEVKLLKTDNLPLGLLDEEYLVSITSVPKGSILFAYTDGLLEYDELDNIVDFIKKHKDNSAEDTAESLYKALVKDRKSQKDDFTCIVMKL